MLGRRRIGSVALLLAAFCSAAGCAAEQQQQQQHQQQQQQLQEQQQQLQLLQEQIPILIRRADGFRSMVDAMRINVDNKLNYFGGRLVTMERTVQELQPLLSRLETKIDKLDSTLESKIDVQESRLESNITVLDGRLKSQVEVSYVYTPQDCSELPASANSGVYLLQVGQEQMHAYCDMETDGGKWTVIQRRTDMEPHQDFFLRWDRYRDGFGDLKIEFWWGLHKLWRMTSTRKRQYQLRIDLEDFNGEKAHAKYNVFRVSSEEEGYRLNVSDCSGNAGDGLSKSNDMKFSTRDKDQDRQSMINCAEQDRGAWWYDRCGYSSLNGVYHGMDQNDRPRKTWQGIWWYTWKKSNESLKKVELKIRRV